MSSTVGYNLMDSDFEINNIESHNMEQNSDVAGAHACIGCLYNFETGSQYNKNSQIPSCAIHCHNIVI
jgi:hypothetical protein